MGALENAKLHEISSKNREGIKICGVIDVDSFDEYGVVMKTAMGGLAVDGDDLRISLLDIDSGIVEIVGRIDGVVYFDENKVGKKGLFSKGKK